MEFAFNRHFPADDSYPNYATAGVFSLTILYIALGGIAGTLSRYGLEGWIQARATSGFPVGTLGASSKMHTDKVLRLSIDLPLIIEVVETDEAIQAILPDLSEMIGGGLITVEKANGILYRPGT